MQVLHFAQDDMRAGWRVVAMLIAIGASGCRSTAPVFGPTPDAARANAEQFFGGLGDRFNTVVRHPRYNASRIKLAHFALSPSRVYDDTTIWTAAGRTGERILLVDAGKQENRYYVQSLPAVGFPDHPGDARHVMRLRKLNDGEFRWTTDVDFAIGNVRAIEFAEVFAAMLRGASAVGRNEAQTRADYRSAFPRGAAAMGRLFSIDTLKPVPLPDGTTQLTFVTRIHAERIQKGFPHFAAYLEKYIKPAHYRLTLADKRGARWMEMVAENYVLTFKLRATPDGRLAPLDGTPRPFPEELYLRGEMFVKIMIFNVGVTDLVADVKWLHGDHERGWLLRFQRPPEWHLPPLVTTMLKSPLRRPFEKGGFTFKLAVRDTPGAQSVIARAIDGTVKESGILRWMSGLSGTAMSDYVGPAEVDENRFVMEAFYGLKADYSALWEMEGRLLGTGSERR